MNNKVECLPRPVAVVTGTSRDVGEYICYRFAKAGWDILGLYKNPQHDQDQIAIIEKVTRFGAKMRAIRADLLDPSIPNLLKSELEQNFGGKGRTLILNAAGGYRKSIAEAEEINVTAQERLLTGLLDNLIPGAVVVFNTSYPSHRYHLASPEEIEELGDYNPVAQTKNAEEMILRSRIPELEDRSIRLAIVVGNGLEGTFVSRVLKRRKSELVDQWLNLTGKGYFPTAEDMADADIRVVLGNYPSGHTEYVGISKEYQLYPS